MDGFFRFVGRMNLLIWILGIFAAHALMYFFLGTASWLLTAFIATVTWGTGLYVLKMISRYVTERQKNT